MYKLHDRRPNDRGTQAQADPVIKGQRERDIDNRHCRSGDWLTVGSPQPNRLVMFPVQERIKLRPSRVFAGRFFVKILSS
jgi:hypothetical protein